MAKLVSQELRTYSYSSTLSEHPQLESSFKNLMQIANQTLPEYKELLTILLPRIYERVCFKTIVTTQGISVKIQSQTKPQPSC